MLHHYNYSTSLSHFLNYHQLEDQSASENDQTSSSIYDDIGSRCKNTSSEVSSKSFTIAAILGLKNDRNNVQNSATDLSVVNLSVHPTAAGKPLDCNRLQLPVHHSSSSHYSVGCSARQTGRVIHFGISRYG